MRFLGRQFSGRQPTADSFAKRAYQIDIEKPGVRVATSLPGFLLRRYRAKIERDQNRTHVLMGS